jgi:hypothetical protein
MFEMFRRRKEKSLIDALTVRAVEQAMEIDTLRDGVRRLLEINSRYDSLMAQARSIASETNVRLDSAIASLEAISDVICDERAGVNSDTRRIIAEIIADELADRKPKRPDLRLVQ